MGVDRGGERQEWGGTHINTGLVYRQMPPPPTLPTPQQENEERVSGGVTDICFHAYSCALKWEGLVADWNWSCREWQPSNRLCPNLRICSSSCLHNEVK